MIARGTVFSESEMGVSGELVIFRDITREKRISKSNGAMLRISMASGGVVKTGEPLIVNNTCKDSGIYLKRDKELTSLSRAKSKAINHLSHELKTPVSIFSGTLNILVKKLKNLPDETWKRSMDRAQRNVERIKLLQDEINDILLEKRCRPAAHENIF